MYCPNCSAELGEAAKTCWNCHANFGEGAAWVPTSAPAGKFRKFAQHAPVSIEAPPARVKKYAEVGPLGSLFLRLMAAVPIWIVLGALAIFSVVPYGGTSGWVSLWGLSTWILLGWVLWPLTRYFREQPKSEGGDAS